MKITFLGTSAGRPTKRRNVTSIVLEFPAPQQNRLWLFDCGEGTQHQCLKYGIKLNRIEKIFITHLHGDHVYGLPGLLGSRGFFEGNVPLTVYGPVGLKAYIEAVFRLTDAAPLFALDVVEIEDAATFLDAGDVFTVRAAELDHRVRCFGYRLEEAERVGALLSDRVRQSGVPNGPLLGELKRGQDVTLASGQIVRAADVTAPAKRGRIVTVLGDTRPCAGAQLLAQDADVLIHEATYASGMEAKADEYAHSTAAQAIATAQSAGAKTLLMTHFSTRLSDEAVAALEQSSQQSLARAFAAQDGFQYNLDTELGEVIEP